MRFKFMRVICFGVILALIITIITVFVCYNKKYEFGDKYSFCEIQETVFSPNKSEAENIKEFLNNTVYEDNNFYGFTAYSTDSIDFYKANSLVNMVDRLNNSTGKQILRNKLLFLSQLNVKNLNFLNIVYYVNICKVLGIPYDKETVSTVLQNYYDNDINLFYINSKSDFINIKIIASSLYYNTMSNDFSSEIFNIKKGMQDAYSTYSFKTDSSATLYNSGGDILYGLSIVGLINNVDLSKYANWFSYWKNYYESLPVDNWESALQFSEFYNVASIFDATYSSNKLTDFYNSIDESEVNSIDDYNFVYNIFRNVDILNNTEVNNLISENVLSVINKDKLFNVCIDAKATAFGVILAHNTDYALNETKLRNYILENYKTLDKMESNYEKASLLYYNLILEQQICGYNTKIDSDFYNNTISDILKNIEYKDNIIDDISSTRRLIEIVMDLQIHGNDISITKYQRNKIKKGLEKAIKDENILNSSAITDIYIINSDLSLNLISNDKFISVYELLKTENGNRMFNKPEYPADILTTYKFFACLERMNIYEYLVAQKIFINSLKVDEGLYNLYNSNVSTYDLVSVLYGNSIIALKIGGSKNA